MAKELKIKGKDINVISKPVALATDGNSITVKPNGEVEVMFFQIESENENLLNVQGVANLRLSNISQLESLNNLFSQIIAEVKAKDKSKLT